MEDWYKITKQAVDLNGGVSLLRSDGLRYKNVIEARMLSSSATVCCCLLLFVVTTLLLCSYGHISNTQMGTVEVFKST